MKYSDTKLCTALYLKLADDMPWPETEPVFYLLSRDGLFLCRNHRFFRSCVPAMNWPGELGGQEPFLRMAYPKLARSLVESVVGFFDLVARRYASEAVVLLVWNTQTESIEPIVPDQTAIVGTSWDGSRYAISVSYAVPSLPTHLLLVGDIHSHADHTPYASILDQADEAHSPGLHLVIGCINHEPPQFHCEVTVDGTRFVVPDLSAVMDSYERRRIEEVPPDWIAKVRVAARPARPAWPESDAAQHEHGGPDSQWEAVPVASAETEISALAHDPSAPIAPASEANPMVQSTPSTDHAIPAPAP